MSWIPRLWGRQEWGRVVSVSPSAGQGQGGNVPPYLAVSAPFVIKVLISSSWPYLAATWRGVLPYLSAQSISLPTEGKTRDSPASLRIPAAPMATSPPQGHGDNSSPFSIV